MSAACRGRRNFSKLSQKRTLGEKFDEAAFETDLKDAVAEVVQQQKERRRRSHQ